MTATGRQQLIHEGWVVVPLSDAEQLPPNREYGARESQKAAKGDIIPLTPPP